VSEKEEFCPEEGECEPAAPAVKVLECVVRFHAEAGVGCDDEGEEDEQEDVGNGEDSWVSN